MRCKVIYILFIAATVTYAGERADYFIAADPLVYTIYNHFEQPVSDEEKTRIVPFSPFRVLEVDITLGDQITHALKVSLQKKTFFLLKDEDGKLSGEKSIEGRRYFRGVELYEDTIEIRRTGPAMVTAEGRRISLSSGTRLVRIFRQGPRWYCTVVPDRTVYGWSTLEPGNAWRKVEEKAAEENIAEKATGIPDALRHRVLERFESANRLYIDCFSHFNNLTRDEKSVPKWQCEVSADRIVCRLSGGSMVVDQLAESSRCLSQDIGNMLTGSELRAICSSGQIIIERLSGRN